MGSSRDIYDTEGHSSQCALLSASQQTTMDKEVLHNGTHSRLEQGGNPLDKRIGRGASRVRAIIKERERWKAIETDG